MGFRRATGTGAITGVTLANGEELPCTHVVLATGHSARDIYELLAESGVRLISKGFALGVRIEHPQPLINRIQYGRFASHPKLPNAAYRVAHTEDERGHCEMTHAQRSSSTVRRRRSITVVSSSGGTTTVRSSTRGCARR